MTDVIDYLKDLGPLQLIGCAGFAAYLWVFAAVQFGWMDGNGPLYAAGNVLAASLVAISLLAEFNLASALIQGSWIVIGLTGLALRFFKPSRAPKRAAFAGGTL